MLTTALTAIQGRGVAQTPTCGFDDTYDTLMVYYPQLEAVFQYNEQMMTLMYLQDSAAVLNGDVYTIPVVVHVIHLGESVGTGTNISDAQVISAIDDLNDRLRNVNAQGTDVRIEFCMAARDPDANPTDGIVRVNGYGVCANGACYQNVGLVMGPSGNELAVKSLSRWPNTDYYNIWVVSKINNNDTTNGTIGFAYFPGSPDFLDGTTILFNAFGTTGNLQSDFNLNTVIAHEIGHGLNLLHTFHGSIGATCPPNSDCETQGDKCCDTSPHTITSTSWEECDTTGYNPCFAGDPYDMSYWRNYMNYSSQTCQDQFTEDQRNRMRCALMSLRPTLMYSLGCEPACESARASFDLTNPLIALNTNLFITNTSNGSEFIWRLDQYVMSTDTNLNYTFDEAGIYNLCLDAISDSCINRYCVRITVYPLCIPPQDVCEFVINGDFEQIENPDADPQDFTQVCGWDDTNSSPFFCASPGNNSIGLFIRTGDYEKITTSIPLILEQGCTYTACFDYLVTIVSPESIMLALSTTNIDSLLPPGSIVIAEVNNPSIDNLNQANHECHSQNYQFHTYCENFTFTGTDPMYLNVTGTNPSLIQSIVFIDNVSINRCTPFDCFPEPDFIYDIDSTDECIVTFYGENTGDPGPFVWNFGDGTSGTGDTVTHKYLFGGTFDVCLIIECDEPNQPSECVEGLGLGVGVKCREIEVALECDQCEVLPLTVAMPWEEDGSVYIATLLFTIPKDSRPCIDENDLFIWSNDVYAFMSSFIIESFTDSLDLVTASIYLGIPTSFDCLADTAMAYITLCPPEGDAFCFSVRLKCGTCDFRIDTEIVSTAVCNFQESSETVFVLDGSFTLTLTSGSNYLGEYFSPHVGFVITNVSHPTLSAWIFDYTYSTTDPDPFTFDVLLIYDVFGDTACVLVTIEGVPCKPPFECDGTWYKNFDDCDEAHEGWIVYETGNMEIPIPFGYELCPQGIIVTVDGGYAVVNSYSVSSGYLYFNIDVYIPSGYEGEYVDVRFIFCDARGQVICQLIRFRNNCEMRIPSAVGSGSIPSGDPVFSVLPNPASTVLHLKVIQDTGSNIVYKAELISSLGSICATDKITAGGTRQMHIHHLPSGVYYLTFRDDAGAVVSIHRVAIVH